MVTGRAGAAERRGTRRPGQRFVPVDYPGPRLQQQSIELLAFREINPQERPKRVALARAIASSKVIAPDAKQRAKHLFIGDLATSLMSTIPGVSSDVPACNNRGSSRVTAPARPAAARPDALSARPVQR
jgi:hypothetical protein